MENTLKNKIIKGLLALATVVLLNQIPALAQDTLVVRGVILSGVNEPIPNVAVSIEGSRDMPAITGDDGRYEVKVPAGSTWMTISPATRYKRKRVYIDKRSQIDVVLTTQDLVAGDDILTVFSQPMSKKNIVSSYTDLDLSGNNKAPYISIDQYMQGRVTGMNLVSQSGTPGAGMSANMRGINSINANNQPLFIIDGMPMQQQGMFGSVIEGYVYNPVSGVNPLDISKLTVFNDPVYTAAYGSKASNGLVVIETLDPTATETSFEVDLRRGFSFTPDRYMTQLDSSQHRTLVNEILYSSGLTEEVLQDRYPSLFLTPREDDFINYRHNTQWQDLIFGNGSFTNFNVKVKGGDEIASYGLSLGFYDNEGIIKNTDYNGLNLRFVSRVNVFRWLKMNASVSFNTSSSNLKESAKVKETNPILAALGKSTMLSPYAYDNDSVRKLTKILANVEDLGGSNPLSIIEKFEAVNRNYHFISNIGFEGTIRKNLILNTNFGITYNALKEKIFMPNAGMESYYNKEAHNVIKAATNTLNSFFNHTYLRYNREFNNDHQLVSTTGMNLQMNQFQYDWGLTKNANENDQYKELDNGVSNMREVGGHNRDWNWLSFYENLSYSYRDKYLASVSLSVDGSSRVGKNAPNTLKIGGNPFGIFYSAGLGWRLSNEDFLNDAAWLEDFKLRLAVGRTGNDDIGESNANNFYRTIQFRETVGLVPVTISNDQLTYETVTQLNGGFDLALNGNRFRLNLDVYQSNVDNMLIYVPLESYMGYDYRPENSGSMKNTGVDMNAFYRVVDQVRFKWDVQASASMVRNRIDEMEGGKQVISILGGELVNMPGETANSFYGYQFKGVYSSYDEAAASGLKNAKGVAYKGGDAIYEDISGPNGTADGVINEYDKVALGSAMPTLHGGITNTFRYGNWMFSAFVQAVTGNKVFNYVRYMNERMTNIDNQSAHVLNRWQYEGQVTDVPRALWNDPVGNSAFSSRWIEDGTYLRLKNVVLSYTIPNEFLVFKNAEFYVSATNLLTFSKYLGYDPEFGYSYNRNDQGIDYGQTPQARQFMLGIKFGL